MVLVGVVTLGLTLDDVQAPMVRPDFFAPGFPRLFQAFPGDHSCGPGAKQKDDDRVCAIRLRGQAWASVQTHQATQPAPVGCIILNLRTIFVAEQTQQM